MYERRTAGDGQPLAGDGAGHGMIDDQDWREQTLPRQIEFLDTHLDGTR